MSENQIHSESIAASPEAPRFFGAVFAPKKTPARYALILSCCAIALLATLAAPSGAAAAANWTQRQLPPMTPYEVEKQSGPTLHGVSCPSKSLCVAVGKANGGDGNDSDTLAFSQAPTGGPAEWHVVTLPPPGGVAENFNLSAISCASQSLCVAVSGSVHDAQKGFIFVSTDPTGGAATWSPTVINEGFGLSDVSCPSASFCAAVGAIGSGNLGEVFSGKVFTSTDPTSGNWQMTQLPGSVDLRGVSCATPSLCVAVGGEGRIFVSTDPTGGASTWQEVGTPGGPVALQGVSCVSTLLCVAGNKSGDVLTSTDPSGGAASWSSANAGGSMRITGVSCPTASRCVAVDDNGDVLISTDPSGGAGSWQFENLVPVVRPLGPENALFSASCASTSLCVLVGHGGRIFTSTEPFSAPAESPAGPPARPRTVLHLESYPLQTRHRLFRVHFRFYSHTLVRGFECKRDRGPYRRCHSPLRYWVASGRRHVLRVRAIGPTGLHGPATIDRFRIGHLRGVHPSGNGGPGAHTSGHSGRWPLHDPGGLDGRSKSTKERL
jgi:hypothetical protein